MLAILSIAKKKRNEDVKSLFHKTKIGESTFKSNREESDSKLVLDGKTKFPGIKYILMIKF